MIKEPSEQELEALAKLAKAVGGDGSFHIAPVYVCDNPDCPDRDREVFPYGVHDAQGCFWNDLCNACFDSLGCSYGDDPSTSSGYDIGDDASDLCHYCDGDGWGIVGLDWDCQDGVNGPYNGEIERCSCCGGSGKEKDATFW